MRSGSMLVLLSLLFTACGNVAGAEDSLSAGSDAGPGAPGSDGSAPGSEGSGATSSTCIPYDDRCPTGEYCQLKGGALTCIPDGTVTPDPGNTNPPCPAGTCSRGGICMPSLSSFGPDQICFQPCNATAPREEWECTNGRHTCWPAKDEAGNELSFGLCDY